MKTIIYPGTFDPATLGHLDVIARAARLFDRVVVGVGDNPAKDALFTREERIDMLRGEAAHLPNVTVKGFSGLVVEFARAEGAALVLRGIRTVSDLEYEVQMAYANRAAAQVETLFIAPSPAFACVNARFIKEIAAMGGNVDGMVSPAVRDRLLARFGRARPRSKP